jgi:hypothetical protein
MNIDELPKCCLKTSMANIRLWEVFLYTGKGTTGKEIGQVVQHQPKVADAKPPYPGSGQGQTGGLEKFEMGNMLMNSRAYVARFNFSCTD